MTLVPTRSLGMFPHTAGSGIGMSYPSFGGAMAEARTEPQEEGVYTCPMHPDVRQREPGTCPKCGMELEPAKD